MIDVAVEYDADGQVQAFTARDHGASPVCAAVSLLIINTVNSITEFTDAALVCEYKEAGGYLRCAFTEPPGKDARLLLDAMMLGLRGVEEKYPQELSVVYAKGRKP